MKILGGVLIWIGFLIMYGAIGTDDFETLQIMNGVNLIPTPFIETITLGGIGILFFLSGIRVFLWKNPE